MIDRWICTMSVSPQSIESIVTLLASSTLPDNPYNQTVETSSDAVLLLFWDNVFFYFLFCSFLAVICHFCSSMILSYIFHPNVRILVVRDDVFFSIFVICPAGLLYNQRHRVLPGDLDLWPLTSANSIVSSLITKTFMWPNDGRFHCMSVQSSKRITL